MILQRQRYRLILVNGHRRVAAVLNTNQFVQDDTVTCGITTTNVLLDASMSLFVRVSLSLCLSLCMCACVLDLGLPCVYIGVGDGGRGTRAP